MPDQQMALPPGASLVSPASSMPLPPGATLVSGSAPAPKQESMLGHAWDWVNKGIISKDMMVRAISGMTPDQLNSELAPYSDETPRHAAIREFVRGAIQDTGQTASSFTSPLAVASMGVGAAGKIPGAVGTVAKAVTGAAGAGLAVKGAQDIHEAGLENTPEAWQQRLQGGAMVAGGAAGAAEGSKALVDPARTAFNAAKTAAVDATKGAAPAASKALGYLSDVVNPEVVGVFSPRLKHVMGVMGKLSEALKEVPEPAAAEAAPPVAETVQPKGDFTFQYRNLPLEVKAKAQTILDAAQEQVKEVVAEAQKQSAPPAKPSRTVDLRDDQAVSQEMNWDLEKQGYRALSEERQKYFADNAPTAGKSQLATQAKVQFILEKAQAEAKAVLEQARIAAEVPVRYTKTTPPKGPAPSSPAAAQSFEDMTDILKRSIDAVNRKKGLGKGN